ncbi:MAG: hypothetical protein IJ547_03545 [Clostridia bacterium]|nr:hypothetical protein [Clostridia bacterium]
MKDQKEKRNRVTITVDATLNEKLDRLKQEQYYHTSYAEMLRDLLELGLKTNEKKGRK